MTNSIAGWIGDFEIKCRNKDTEEITRDLIKNRITNAALNQIAEVLTGVAPDMQIKWLALGTGSTPPSDTDTQLVSEIFRAQPVANPTRTGTGQVECEFVILDSEAVGHIREVGIFGGSGATDQPNTGVLISRILWNKEKTNSEEITVKRLDRVVRG